MPVLTDLSQPMTVDEQTLARRAGEGDHDAFSVLFTRYKNRLYRFCLFMLGDEATAEDIYQEVFLNFYRACRAGREMHNVRGYLITAARSRCLNHLRNSNRTSLLEEGSEPAYLPDVTAGDTSEHLRRALMQIPAQYREAFLLFEIEGYSYEEIANQVGITRDVVKNRIYRAKQALQKLLGPILRDESSDTAAETF